MKIAILSFYSGYVNRGVEAWVDELSKRLAKKIEILVFQAGPLKEKTNYNAKRISFNNNPSNIFGFMEENSAS